jgi:hypothetical protein
MNDHEARLIALLKEYMGRKPFDRSSRVYHDLCLSGDDAFEFMERLAREFQSKMDEFNFDRFFPNESEALLEHWASRLGFKSKRQPLTIDHLLHVVQAGRWLAPAAAGLDTTNG